MNIAQQIRFLVNERDSALRKAREIEQQIAEVRAALGIMGAPQDISTVAHVSRPTKPRQPVALGGLSQQQILDVLAKREPQCTAQLLAALPEMTTLRIHLKAMVDAGLVVRHRRIAGGNVFWYARSEEAFNADDYILPMASAEVIAADDAFRSDQDDHGKGLSAGNDMVPVASADDIARG